VLQKYTVFAGRIFESLFIDVKFPNNKNFIFGSMYRPGTSHPTPNTSALFDNFFDIFSNILSSLVDDNVKFYLLGDLNIDSLNYNKNTKATECIDLLFSFGYLQTITKPTRCTDKSATLIYHVVTNCLSDSYKSVILTSHISDHFPVIFYLPINKYKKLAKIL